MHTTGRACIIIAALIGLTSCFDSGGPSQVVGGKADADYTYPWVVRNQIVGCGGVLIHPKWVLTAAHCVMVGSSANTHFYKRTDPYTGTLHEDKSDGSFGSGPALNAGAYPHPMYDPQKVDNPHDIALLRLREPFPIDRFIQTVALPTTPHQANLVGSLASFDHNMLLPEGQVAVFRAPIPTDSAPEGFVIDTANAQGSICGGDSGSGLVTYEDGRATVRGIVFAVLVGPSGDCKTVPSINQHFSDVFAHRDWILETMRTVDYRLSGTNRVRWTGWRGVTGTRGVMGIGCENDYGTMWGPLDVRGVELGANCVPGSGQGVVCSVNAAQTNPYPLAITGFTMKTTCAPHGTSVESLPFSANAATYNGLAPVSPDPPGVCTREFTCQLGRSWDFVISDVFKFTQ